jgi:hypothetical protein
VYVVTGPRLPRIVVTEAAVARLVRSEGAVLPAVLALLQGVTVSRLRLVEREGGLLVCTVDEVGRAA